MVRLLLAAALLIVLGGLTVRFTDGRLLGSSAEGNSAGVTRAPAVATPVQVTYEVTEAALTAQVNQHLTGQQIGNTPLGPATLRQLTVHLTPGHVMADGEARVAGAVLPVGLAGSLAAQAGHPIVTLQDATVAGVAVPDDTRAAMQRTMQAEVESALAAQRMTVTSLSVLDGKIVAVGTRS